MTKPRKLAVGIGSASVACALLAALTSFPANWVFGATSISCALSAVAYLRNRPEVYGKRAGRLVWWRALPTVIFLGAFRLACGLMRVWRRHPKKSRVSASVWVSGRVEHADLPRDVAFIVDLVSEFPEPPAVRDHPGYRFLPVLDGSVPPREEPVLNLLEELEDPSRVALVHCDSGIGRAPTFAALLLLRRGEAPTLEAAIARIEEARPFIHLGSAERAFLGRIAPKVKRPIPPPSAVAS